MDHALARLWRRAGPVQPAHLQLVRPGRRSRRGFLPSSTGSAEATQARVCVEAASVPCAPRAASPLRLRPPPPRSRTPRPRMLKSRPSASRSTSASAYSPRTPTWTRSPRALMSRPAWSESTRSRSTRSAASSACSSRGLPGCLSGARGFGLCRARRAAPVAACSCASASSHTARASRAAARTSRAICAAAVASPSPSALVADRLLFRPLEVVEPWEESEGERLERLDMATD
jgi:hypothetical protein